MKGYRVMLEKEIVELWRSYRLAITCGLFVVLGIGVAVVERYLPAITNLFGQVDAELRIGKTGVPDLIEALVRTLWLFGPLAAVLLTMGTIAGERGSRTAALVLARPISRAAFVWAKFVAVAMVLGLATGLAVAAAWLYGSVLFGGLELLPWIQVWLLAWLDAVIFAAITLAASATFASPVGAAAVGLAAFGAIGLASTVVTLNLWLPTGLGELAQAFVLNEVGPDVDPFRSVAASAALLGAALLVAWLWFRRVDL